MSNLSDKELQEELQKLTNKVTGPVLPSTRPLLVKRLLKLRAEREKAVFAFSSDEEDHTTPTTSKPSSSLSSSRTSRKSISTQPKSSIIKSKAASSIKTKSPTPARKSIDAANISNGLTRNLDELTNDQIAQNLHELTGTKYPISDGTRSVMLKKLKKLLEDEPSAAYPVAASADSTVEPMDTQFSDDDMMNFEPDPDMSAIRVSPPAMVDQSINTSSFLDGSVPEYSDNGNGMPDILEIDSRNIAEPIPGHDLPAPSFNPPKRSTPYADKPVAQGFTRRSVGGPVLPEYEDTTSPELPSRPVTTRRSQPVIRPPPVTSNRPAPSSPPRSMFARRPLGTTFRNISTEVTPKPSSRFSMNLGETREKLNQEDSRRFQSDYSTRHSTGAASVPPNPRTMKMNKDRDMSQREKGLSWAQLLPSYLLHTLVILILALMAAYFYVWLTREAPIDELLTPRDRVKEFICHETDTSSECFTPSDARQALKVRDRLQELLSQHAGLFECGRDGYESRRAVKSEMRHKIVTQYPPNVGGKLWDVTMKLIIANPHWGIILYGENDALEVKSPAQIWSLEAESSSVPMTCIIHSYTVHLIYTVLAAIAVAGLGYLAYLYGKYRKIKNEERKCKLFDLVENIIDMLESQCKISRDSGGGEKPYLAINHVRDHLIQPADRRSMSSLWEDAVKFISENETRVREEVQQVAGEEYKVWRWLQSDPLSVPSPSRSRGWQGSVFSDESPRQKLKFRPTPCIKIRNMFDKYSEDGTSWPTLVEKALLDKLGDNHGVVHIHVDRESEENRVYMKFATEKQSGKGFTSLNGSYYNGRCVQVKFLLPDKYYQRFPEARYLTRPIQ